MQPQSKQHKFSTDITTDENSEWNMSCFLRYQGSSISQIARNAMVYVHMSG